MPLAADAHRQVPKVGFVEAGPPSVNRPFTQSPPRDRAHWGTRTAVRRAVRRRSTGAGGAAEAPCAPQTL